MKRLHRSQFRKRHWYLLLFFTILLIGLYLRFYRIEFVQGFGWDQGRDAWLVRDILQGKLVLHGPRTGIGHVHLGPLYFYFLAPFYYFAAMDPMASNYFNLLVNIFNFSIIYVITKKLFSDNAALFVVFVYAFSSYIIKQNQIPWNVSLVPGVTVLIFYSLYQISQQRYKWFLALGALCGFFFHLHFTAVFLPLIVLLSLLIMKKEKTMIPWILGGIALGILFLIPIIIYNFLGSQGEYYRYKDFIRDYVHGLHVRFLLHRLPDSLTMFRSILHFKSLEVLQYILPVIFCILILFFEKNKKYKTIGLLIIPWFITPLIGFTLYKGPISDYYFLMTAPFVIYILLYLQLRLLKINYPLILPLLIVFWGLYFYANTNEHWIKPTSGQLHAQKERVKQQIEGKQEIPYKEGDIEAYMYQIYKDQKSN